MTAKTSKTTHPSIEIDSEFLDEIAWEAGRRSFGAFCNLIDIPGVDVPWDQTPHQRLKRPFAKHHALMIEKFEQIDRGEIKRLIIQMPPGGAKSAYTKMFAAWYGGKRRRNVIAATYNTSFGEVLGDDIRGFVDQPAYKSIFGVGLDQATNAKGLFKLSNGSKYLASGFGGGITGNRANLIIIDDPHKNRIEAESLTMREMVKNEYRASVKTRGSPNYAIVLVQTRWHQDDLAGSILPEEYNGESGQILCRDGQYWEVINIPAEAEEDDILGREPGEMFWPEWFPKDHWDEFRSNQRDWASLYQQRPSPVEGSFFKAEWFDESRYAWTPDWHKTMNLNYYLTSDHAPSGKGDWNVFSVWGVDSQRNVYLVDQFRRKCRMPEALGWDYQDGKAVLRGEGALPMIKKWKPLCWFPEKDPTWHAEEGNIKAAMRDLNVFCRIEPINVMGKGNKEIRAQAYQSRASLGLVHLPRGMKTGAGHDVGDLAVEEYLSFPNGKHDDQVDAHAMIARLIAEAHPAMLNTAEEREAQLDRYREVTSVEDDHMDVYF